MGCLKQSLVYSILFILPSAVSADTITLKNGKVLLSANLVGGYLIALTLLFISSGIAFLQWLRTSDTTGIVEKLGMSISSILLALHTFSGVIYFIRLYSVKTFEV